MKRLLMVGLLASSMVVTTLQPVIAAPSVAVKKDFKRLPKPGVKIPLDADHYFTYGFDKPAKLGTAIMKVEIFNRDGKRDTSFVVKGDSDMPSMRGAHASGEKDFALSAKGVYLQPMRLVMLGDWEVTFTFVKNGQALFRGAYLFDL